MKYLISLAILHWFFVFIVMAQDNTKMITKDTLVSNAQPVKTTVQPERRWGDGGAGLGLDYGGLVGARASFYPFKYMAIFASVGWEIVGIGWNAGVLGRFIPADGKHGARPYLKVMYGVNGATKIEGKSGYDKMYYGITVGAGLEARFGKKKKSGLNIDINVPIRSADFWDTINEIKDNPNITMNSEPWPVTISIGYIVEF
jgi:hypothetical protein